MTAELVHNNTGKGVSTWETPQALFDVLHREFQFTIDVCAEPHTAKLPTYWTKEDNAFAQDWGGHTCWCNPPYTRGVVDHFVARAEAYAHLGLATTVLLLPASTDSVWWWKYITPYEVRFLQLGRLKFGEYYNKKQQRWVKGGAPFRSTVVIMRKDPAPIDYSKLWWDWKAEK